MTLQSEVSRVSYSGGGSQTAFSTGFYFLADADLRVIVRAADGTETVQTLGSDYTVSGAGNSNGGTVTFTTAPANGTTVVIIRDPAITQLTDYNDQDPFPADSHERALDKLTMLVQRNAEKFARAILLKETSDLTDLVFPEPEAGQFLRWNGAADGLENGTTESSGETFPATALRYLRRNAAGTAFEALTAQQSSNLDTLRDIVPGAAGQAILADAAEEDVRDYLDTAPYVATRAALAALDTTKDTVAYLTQSGQEGQFNWDGSDLSAEVAIDTTEVVYVAPTGENGSAGAWVRALDNNEISPLMAGATVTSHAEFAAMDSGDQTALMTANAAAVDACGLLMRDLGFAIRGPGLENPIYTNGSFNWMRNSTTGPMHFRMTDLWLDDRSSGETSGAYVQLGATSSGNLADRGSFYLENVRFYGPESTNPSSAVSSDTSRVGLLLEYALNITEINVGAHRFKRGTERYFVFPSVNIHPQYGENFTGMLMKSATNHTTSIVAECQECWFGIVVQFNSDRVVNQTWIEPRGENTEVPMLLDMASATGGADRFRDINIQQPWLSGQTYDSLRVGYAWNEEDPSDISTENTDRILGLNVKGGNWTRPESGAWSATAAAVRLATTQGIVRGVNMELPVEDTANAVQGTITGGQIRFISTIHAATGAPQWQDKLVVFDVNGDRAVIRTEDGDTILGAGTNANIDPAVNNNVGIGLDAQDGIVSLSADAAAALIVNRKTDDGQLITFKQDGTTEGSIGVSGTTVSLSGAHLTRWGQIEGAEVPLRGTVLSSTGIMCEWLVESWHETVLIGVAKGWPDQPVPRGVKTGKTFPRHVHDASGNYVEVLYVARQRRVRRTAPYAGALRPGERYKKNGRWHTIGAEGNEQLTMIRVSDKDCDRTVAGVFDSVDRSDTLGDLLVAQTGDFTIRIGKGVTVENGDLLVSAGDGTARPLDPDTPMTVSLQAAIVGKVTSDHVVETFEDGSYRVPALIMAC